MLSFIASLLIFSGIITGFNTTDKFVVLTFDACETKSPAYFDEKILSYMLSEKIPFTMFLSGKFIERNYDKVSELSKLDFVEIENHSYSHNDFRKLSSKEIEKDIKDNENLIYKITARNSIFFRFPYGYYDEKSLYKIKNMGYKVVHWDIPSGDPDKNLTKSKLVKNVLDNTKSGTIHIFHINGRGWKTGEALPEIVDYIKSRGYKFLLLKDAYNLSNNSKKQL